MPTRRSLASLIMFAVLAAAPLPAAAQNKIKTVATFSILGDFVKNVGGDRVEVTTLVGPNSDTHVYSPTPADAAKVGAAQIIVTNGLGLEGWMARLAKAASGKAATVVATSGIKPLKMEDAHVHASDPHAWQSVANAKIYVANIRDGLIQADPAGKATYEANAQAYLAKLDALEQEVKDAIARIPVERRRIITSHDAFGYFANAYGMQFIAPSGVSTESEASAKDVARIITQIRKQKIPAVFLENVSDPRLIEQIARESGAKVGGKVYSDALSKPDEAAGTYIDMMRNNIGAFSAALVG
jgi:zinc/manganese transport system substrate-binding protein